MFSFYSIVKPGGNRRINVLSAEAGLPDTAAMAKKPPLRRPVAPAASRPHRVAMIAFPGAELLDVVGPLEAFASADALAVCGSTYAVTIVAKQAGPLPASSGLAIHATADFAATEAADTILVAGGAGVEAAARDPALRGALRQAAAAGRRVGSVCTGALALAAAGLLDGRRAVTHWNWCEHLAARYPAVKVERDPIFLVDRGIWTSAGVTAGIDMALAMIERDHGPKLAVRTAQELVMFRRRPGGQSQFSVELAAAATGSRPMQSLQEWVLAHLEENLSVEALAAQAAMSPRNFARVFQRETGMTPARFVERARLQRARELLETSTKDLETIAACCGYGSADVLARAMLRRLNANPSDYRQRFGAIWRKGEDHHAAG
jgi:transcriptional regulator GlxA family with amidase domain